MKSINIKEVTGEGGVYIGGQVTNLSMEEIILRVAKKAYPQWAHEFSTPTLIPGAYRIWAVGTNGDVTILIWQRADGEFTAKHECW